MNGPLFTLGALAAAVALAEVLAQRTALRHLGSALLVILITAVAVNVGILAPAGTESSDPVYGALLGPVAQGAIFLLLLQVRLTELRRAGRTMILAFCAGAIGTLLGVILAAFVVGIPERLAPHGSAVAAMFVGTYTGGSVNFNAMAIHYGIQDESGLYVAAAVVDNVMTTIWMAITLLVPRFFRRGQERVVVAHQASDDEENVAPLDLAVLIALSCAAVWGSEHIARALSTWVGVAVPAILVLTTVALVAAQLPGARRLRGARLLALFAVYLFLAAIGALCDLTALEEAGGVGLTLFAFVAIVLAVHGGWLFGLARVAGWPTDVVAVASQANVGGGTSALALARSLDRADLVVPAILVGSLGNAVGNYLGFIAAAVVQN